MPGNRALYDRAMEQSREAARQKHWEEALKQAIRALQEFPPDADARSSAAVALFNTGKYPQALQVFEELRNHDANNPFFLEYIARTNEQLGNRLAAVGNYTQLAELQQSRRLNVKAAEALREVLRLTPDADNQRLRLARIFEETGNTPAAAAEYITLARRAQNDHQLDNAAQHAEMALRLDPNNREPKDILAELHTSMAEAAMNDEPAPASNVPAPRLNGMAGGMTGALRSQQFTVEKIVAEAQALQEAGDLVEALEQYERAVEMGAERNDVFYSMGLLYQDRGDHERAVEALHHAANDSEYALSAHYALGSSYQTLGKLPQAAQEYEQTIHLVDLQSIGRAEADDLIQMYESAASVYTEINDVARAASLYSTLANFLAGKRWGKEQADEFRRKAKELTDRNMFAKLRTLGTGALLAPEPPPSAMPPPAEDTIPETWGKIRPITDFLRPSRVEEPRNTDVFAAEAPPKAAPPDPLDLLATLPSQPTWIPMTVLDTSGLGEHALRYVQASEKYVEQGLTMAALDACFEVIALDGDFLPIHLRIGEIYERENRPDEALAKYQLLIDTFLVRDEPQRAIDVYFRLIDLSPDTTNSRSRLAELLKNDGRIDAAAEQLAIVANMYFRLGQTNKSLEEYRRGLQWAPNNAKLHAQYGQSLLKLERYEAALGEFRKALELNPDDLAGIARINATLALMGEQPTAIWQSLATLLERLKTQAIGGSPAALNDVQSEYRTALIASDAAILHYILGLILQTGSNHSSALLEFEQAEDLQRTDEDPALPAVLVHQAMADSHIALGQADQALAQLQKGHAIAQAAPAPAGTARYPFSTPLSQGELVRRMAEAYGATGDLDGAERALQQAKQHLPYDRAIYTKLADIYFRQGKLNEALTQLDELATHYESRQDLDRAIETLEYGAKLAPNNIANSRRLAQFSLRRGFLDKGLEGLTRVAELQRRAGQLKDAVASLQQIAEVYWTLGQQDKTRDVYDKIVKIAPTDLEARQWLSFMYTLAGHIPEAVAEKKQLVHILMQQRDYEGAIAELHQIYGLDQSDAETLFQLADVLMRREEYEQAIRTYARLAKMNVDATRVQALQIAARRMLEQQKRAKGS